MERCVCGDTRTLGRYACPTCGESWLIEALSHPRRLSGWYVALCRAGTAIVVLSLLATVALATLRPPYAIRKSRALLDSGDAPAALQLLTPYLEENADDPQGWELAIRAQVMLGEAPQASRAYEKLAMLDSDAARGLRPSVAESVQRWPLRLECDRRGIQDLTAWSKDVHADFHAELESSARAFLDRCAQQLDCDRTGVKWFAAWSDEAPAGLRKATVAAARGFLGRCSSESEADPRFGLSFLSFFGKKDWLDGESLQELFVQPIVEALEKRDYGLAERLAVQALGVTTRVAPLIEEQLKAVRMTVRGSVEAVEQLCDRIRQSPEYRIGRFYCYPESLPKTMQLTDTWRNAIRYAARNYDKTTRCYQGFELRSAGGDGQFGEEGTGPATDIVCSVRANQKSVRAPTHFWIGGS